jgi:sulfur-carrier protein
MSITVLIPTPLRRHTGGQEKLTLVAANLPELVDRLGEAFPELGRHLLDESRQVRRFINFYVNEEDIRFLGHNGYQFKEGDEVMIVPSIAGGREVGQRAWA